MSKLIRRTMSRFLSRRWMRRDWDARARENAAHYIDCGHSSTGEAFWSSGEADLRNLILQDIRLEPSAHALEIGCGLGRLLRPLSLTVEKAIGIDISPEMIARAREALADLSNVELWVTKGRLDDVSDASLDLVYSFIVFQHVPSRAAVYRYLRESARALRGGGVFRFQVDGRRRRRIKGADTWLGVWFESDALCRTLSRMGLEVVDRWGEGTQYFWITARRRIDSSRPETNAVTASTRSWNIAALERLAADLGFDAGKVVPAVVSGNQSLRDIAEGFVRRESRTDGENFVRRAYETSLGRPADPQGLSFYISEITGGKPRGYVVDCLIASAEARERFRMLEREPIGA
ncbi:MAG TPA: methyltransferase domain-containing protein [Thermoanaerobaculia bacterium]|nr:methyltransferase domain-containing protein [Thermoanaerobaculia bacterium]